MARGAKPRMSHRHVAVKWITHFRDYPPGPLLDERRPEYDRLDTYYAGRQSSHAFMAPEVRASLGNRLPPLVLNWPRLIVSAVEERLDVDGFRLSRDEPADRELWRIWQANRLDEGSQQAHLDALVHGCSYVMVWASVDPRTPRISIETARQTAVERDAMTGEITVALKRWTEGGYGHAVVFGPELITRCRSSADAPRSRSAPGSRLVPAAPPERSDAARAQLPGCEREAACGFRNQQNYERRIWPPRAHSERSLIRKSVGRGHGQHRGDGRSEQQDVARANVRCATSGGGGRCRPLLGGTPVGLAGAAEWDLVYEVDDIGHLERFQPAASPGAQARW